MKELISVLIVEDDELHTELIKRAFEDERWARFKLRFSSNLMEARIYMEDKKPDIVICDWLLPDGRGIELFSPDKERLSYPIIMMTSYGNEELAVETIKAGALDYLVKSPEAFAGLPDFILRGLREWEHIRARYAAENKLRDVLLQTVESLASMLEKRDPYTSGHQKKVSVLACAIAEEMGLPAEIIEGIHISAILHDIGKISIPAEFLSKPGRLSPIEFDIIKTHPFNAYEMLKSIDFPYPVAQIILQHHEKLDGSGYPYGLLGPDILLEARIIAVADVVEAISSHRPYRPALGIQYALEEIAQNAGKLYDREVVEACLTLFCERGFSLDSIREW
ncbi:MAG: HD domain-containing protein [Syntrophomonas sp.]|uniref:HD-GYP domain-containing protein n=1 Tax=Syntrophomonas sp. TaxID=2053627 RepID=UPI00261A2B20|nr:HD domain-containing phosphohydrolase [Syntrophomonas sp.]MDD2510069.1 HD domain-containing protein [Syntrophomonas sp.]MDD3879710.1 HD domain-containing protein [Syntrophomonas sp.]MDD4626781.1 HD domain-containing protein [Syntrophomonas sp.]